MSRLRARPPAQDTVSAGPLLTFRFRDVDATAVIGRDPDGTFVPISDPRTPAGHGAAF